MEDGFSGSSTVNYEVAVVGAGVAGCVVSQKVASKGFKVCLLERKPSNRIGEKVCGDGVGKHEFSESNVPPPQSVERQLRGVEFHVLNDIAFTVEGEGYSLNRSTFGQELLGRALDSGVHLHDSFHVRRLLSDEGHIVGVEGRSLAHGKCRLNFEVVVDASGVQGVVRNMASEGWPIRETPRRFELGVGYREICRLKEGGEYCKLFYDWSLTPGGYCWIIPKEGAKANIGILMPAGLTNILDLAQRFKAFKARMRIKSKPLNSGFGFVPLRAPLKYPCWGNLMAVGDAAFLANPLNGGGIGPALKSASMAADALVEALRDQESIMKRLWLYNVGVARSFGLKHTVNNALKEFLLKSNPKEAHSFLHALGFKKTYHSTSFLREISKPDYLRLLLKLSPKMAYRLFKVLREARPLKAFYSRYPPAPTL